jgi:hypothetical protein
MAAFSAACRLLHPQPRLGCSGSGLRLLGSSRSTNAASLCATSMRPMNAHRMQASTTSPSPRGPAGFRPALITRIGSRDGHERHCESDTLPNSVQRGWQATIRKRVQLCSEIGVPLQEMEAITSSAITTP